MLVTHSDWAASVVAVVKADKKIRMCGDYKITVKNVLQIILIHYQI